MPVELIEVAPVDPVDPVEVVGDARDRLFVAAHRWALDTTEPAGRVQPRLDRDLEHECDLHRLLRSACSTLHRICT